MQIGSLAAASGLSREALRQTLAERVAADCPLRAAKKPMENRA